MRKLATIMAMVTLATAIPLKGGAAEHKHGTMQHGSDMTASSQAAYEEVVNGIKAIFEIVDMQAQMKDSMPKGMSESHHIMVRFADVTNGSKITEGDVTVKIQGPDKTEQTRNLRGMQGHFGADVNLSKKGKYGVMCKFRVKDDKIRTAKFWYVVK